MKTRIGLPEETCYEVGQILNLLLADEYVLNATTRDYHWNVTGPKFDSLHKEFEAQSKLIAGWIDEVAERARAIGAGARGSWVELTTASRVSASAGMGLLGDDMLAELLSLHETIIVQIRADTEACSSRYKDAGTTDFLAGLLVRHEKAAWTLRAQLEPEEA